MARVHLIGTGGTIASRSAVTGGGNGAVAADSARQLLSAASDVDGLEVTAEDALRLGSYQLRLADLYTVAKTAVERASDPKIDGVVVTHGTDTLEETAFLVELVNGTGTTVVFTGAQHAADAPDSDGPRNLRQAARVAADPRFRDMGALISFAGRVHTARGTRKADTVAPDPFKGGALVGGFRGDSLDQLAGPVRRGALSLPGPSFGDVDVEIVTAYPGSSPERLLHAVDRGASAVVLAGTGVGNAGPGYAEAVATLRQRGIPVVLATRVPWGPTVPVYGNGGGVDLVAAGAVPAGQLNVFQARILAAVLLTNSSETEDFSTQFSAWR